MRLKSLLMKMREDSEKVDLKFRKLKKKKKFQENQTGALYQPRGLGWGGDFKTEGICVYLWLIHVDV